MTGKVTQGPWSTDAEGDAERRAGDPISARQQALDECIAAVQATLPARGGHICCQGLRHAILDSLTKLRDEDGGAVRTEIPPR